MAACLYRYYIDHHELLYGPLDAAAADAVYQDAKKLGTTLQVREDMWPADRIAFDEYSKRSLEDLRIDPPVREHLYGIAAAASLPTPLRQLVGPVNLFATTGFLPQEFRTHMRLPRTREQQAIVRAAVGDAADRRPRYPPRLLAVLVWALLAQHADEGTPRQASHLTRLP